jgi:hypothetical protein
VAVRAVVAGLSVLLLSGCSSPATAAHPTPAPTSVVISENDNPGTSSGPSGPAGSSGGDYTNSSGPGGFSGATGPYYSSGSSGPYGSSGATGQPGCWVVSYGLCVSGATGNAPGPVRTDPPFPCKIAVSSGQPGGGGFIALPGGTFALDPSSDVSIPVPVGSPYRPTNFGFTFRAGRWFPVKPDWVSPDGSRYAYPDPTGIHVITVADGTDTVLGKGQAWQLLYLQNDGAYGVAANHTIGLWFLPLTGSPRQLTDRGYWITMSGSVAYGMQAQSVPSGVTNTVLRLDPATGLIVTWWSDPPAGVQLLATAPDNGVLMLIPSQYFPFVDVRRMSQPDQWIPVFSDVNGQRYLTPPVLVDSRGTWLSDNGGVWLSSSSGTLLVSTVSGQLASGCLP